MKKIILLITIYLITLTQSHAQLSVNDYKYVIVENQFHFQNEPGEYNLNHLVKFLFRKNGFRVIIEGEPLPADLKSNYCLALTSEVTAKGALRTKAKVVLRDCDNNIVYTSAEGMTKEKDFARAYDLSIRNAFESFSILNYHYVPNERITSQGQAATEVKEAADAKQEIEELKAKIEVLEEQKQDKSQTTNKDEQIVEMQQDDSDMKSTEALKEKEETAVIIEKMYYKAIATDYGYQLIDSKTNVIAYSIVPTEIKGVFILKNKTGIVYKKGEKWVREFVEGNTTTFESLDIRF